MAAKLTPARRRALEWLRDNEPVHLFPVGVNISLIKKMARDGLVVEGQVTKRGFPLPLVSYSLSDAGRKSLSLKPEDGR